MSKTRNQLRIRSHSSRLFPGVLAMTAHSHRQLVLADTASLHFLIGPLRTAFNPGSIMSDASCSLQDLAPGERIVSLAFSDSSTMVVYATTTESRLLVLSLRLFWNKETSICPLVTIRHLYSTTPLYAIAVPGTLLVYNDTTTLVFSTSPRSRQDPTLTSHSAAHPLPHPFGFALSSPTRTRVVHTVPLPTTSPYYHVLGVLVVLALSIQCLRRSVRQRRRVRSP